MISAFYAIAGEHPTRIALSYGGKCPSYEIFGTVAEAVHRIEELIETSSVLVPHVSQRRRSLDRPPKDTAVPIMELMAVWSNSAGQWTPELHANIFAALPSKDISVIRRPAKTERLVIDHWGAGFNFFGSRWPDLARGKEVEDHPSPNLGRWAASQYRMALADEEPHFQDVQLALSSGGGAVRRRQYARLTLPWSERGGDQYVMMVGFDTRQIGVSRDDEP